MTAASPTRTLLQTQVAAHRRTLLLAALSGGLAAGAATLLLGLSGWFLAGAALAGLSGSAAVLAFNYLLPSAGLRGLAILRTAGRYGERLTSHEAAFRALAALRASLFTGIVSAPPVRSLALSQGEASARLIQDINVLESAFVQRSAPWAAAVAVGTAGLLVGLASVPAAMVFLAGMGIQVLIGRSLARRWSESAGRDRQQAVGRLKDGLGAYLAASAELQAFNITGPAIDTLMAHDTDLGAARLRLTDAETRINAVQASLTAITVALVAVLAAKAALPLAALAVLAALAGSEGIAGLLRAAQDRGAQDAAVTRLDEVLTSPASDNAPPPTASDLVIDGLAMGPGFRLGIIGPSGCGKTRTLEALVGLLDAPQGRFRVGSTPLEARPTGWARPLFAYAPQDARLLTGTIEENLRLAAPHAQEADLWEALRDAQLEDRIRQMPRGLSTWIGDGGEILSGGERRRLSLARAFLRPAPWLLLDEPTEGLDHITEAALVQALDQRLRRTGQGLVMISHRPAPLALCQQSVAPGEAL